MGIKNLLQPILEAAGHKVNLRDYASGVQHNHTDTSSSDTHTDYSDARVPLRIGVDVSGWIHSACHAHCDMLWDERHLSNYGRSELMLHQGVGGNSNTDADAIQPAPAPDNVQAFVLLCTSRVVDRLQVLQDLSQAEILVVLDGKSTTAKLHQVQARALNRQKAQEERDGPVDVTGDPEALDRRIKKSRQAGAGEYYPNVVAGIVQQLRLNQIPFLVAPYEADGQLAYLSLMRYIDLIVTEDGDLLGYGASPILYKISDHLHQGEPLGILVRQNNLACKYDKTVHSGLDLKDFTPAMLAVMFVIAGCDYNPQYQIKGVGIAKACKIVREVYFGSGPDDTRPALEMIFDKVFDRAYSKETYTDDFKDAYKKASIEALLMFRHPVIYDPLQGCITMKANHPDPELVAYAPYAELLNDADRREDIVGKPFDLEVAHCVAEGWISPRTWQPYDGTESSCPDFVAAVIARLD